MGTVTIPSASSEQPTPQHVVASAALDSADEAVAPHEEIARPRVDAGGLALGILATAAVVFTLDWAQSLFISLFLGIFFAYTLNPLVTLLERIMIPRVFGTSIVMVVVVGVLIVFTYALRGQMETIIDQLPEAASKLSAGLASMRKGQIDTLKKVQTAADKIEKAASPSAGNTPSKSKPSPVAVVVEEPAFKFLWAGSKGVLGGLGQAAMVVFLVFFLLLSGDIFKRKLVRITGPLLSRRKITVHILNDINSSIQRYMVMLLLTNALVIVLAWLVFNWIGLENAGAWAVASGLLHIIPYFGPGITAAAVGMAAYIQFDSITMALLVAGASVTIATIVGTFITTWMTGRIVKMNTAAVFISLLFWSWLWGVWGMLLSMPIIVVIKVVSQHIVQLQSVSELLSE